MPYLIAIVAVLVAGFVVYLAGRRAGYEAGRLAEREEWATKIRELDE
jgi:hypothetical protein